MPTQKQKPSGAGTHSNRLTPPEEGVTVRMYRIGHGDCFLLAFPGKAIDQPVYVLIDCGYKPGSPNFINTTAKEITDNIREVTGGHIDVAIITHEHQDHVNAITPANFSGVRIGETWYAWTEDPNDNLANHLRRQFNDRLLSLMQARNRLAADTGAADKVRRIDDFLAFELGGDDEHDFSAAAASLHAASVGGAEGSHNKRAMKLLKTLSQNGVRYLSPHENALSIPGVDHVRVFPLAPPRDEALLHSGDPEGEEGFNISAFGAATMGSYFASAVGTLRAPGRQESPFASRYRIPWESALEGHADHSFAAMYYGATGIDPSWPASSDRGESEVEGNPAWRRIDNDWLFSAEQLALDMNNDTNNSSLVLAFELTAGGKVLLFAADAQRGSWISWANGDWIDGERIVTARDLLARTVLYKVGHHGSHNATLKGKEADSYANLDWMAQGDFAHEFSAMITAVRPWAETKKGWDHPLREIKEALLQKAAGRVFQTDTKVADMKPLGSKSEWDAFQSRIRDDRLFVDFCVTL